MLDLTMPNRSQLEFIKMWRDVAQDDLPTVGEAQAWIAARLDAGMPDSVVGWLAWRDVAERVGSAVGPDLWSLTPRGADLIATAKGIDLDALVPDDEQVIDASYELKRIDCPDCEGVGRIPIVVDSAPVEGKLVSDRVIRVWDMGCGKCGGSGKVKYERFTFDARRADPNPTRRRYGGIMVKEPERVLG